MDTHQEEQQRPPAGGLKGRYVTSLPTKALISGGGRSGQMATDITPEGGCYTCRKVGAASLLITKET